MAGRADLASRNRRQTPRTCGTAPSPGAKNTCQLWPPWVLVGKSVCHHLPSAISHRLSAICHLQVLAQPHRAHSLEPPEAPGASFCVPGMSCIQEVSPLRAVMTGTASRSKGVRREAESEGSVKQDLDPTNRNRIEGQRSGVTRQWTRRPDSHPGAAGINPG